MYYLILIGCFLLVAILSFFVFLIWNEEKEEGPQFVSDCPDFFYKKKFLDENNETKYECRVNKNIYSTTLADNCKIWDFTKDTDDCEKKKKSLDCNIFWDGITNNKSLTCLDKPEEEKEEE